MVAEVRSRDLVDPIDSTSLLNLLPQTFKGLKKNTTTISDTNSQNDMELIKNHHKSVAIKNPENFMEQARKILNRNSEHINNELPCPGQSNSKEDDIVVEKEKVREKGRRPGLLGDHKRAKFSLKPNVMSQTNYNLDEMEKEIEKISDPVEYFKAYERLENAKKEIQRQTGGIPTNSTKDDDISRPTRVRRPGLGGTTAGQKHRYSLVGMGNNEVLSSQLETDLSSQSRDKPTTGTVDQHGPTEESISMDVGLEKDSADASHCLLDELLSTSYTDLDGDGAIPFLQERLQVKPINVEKLSLPDLDSFRSINVMAPAESAGRSRESFSEIGRNKTPTEIHPSTNTYMRRRASPTSPKSPLASVSALTKRLSDMRQTASTFSFPGIDSSPVRNTSLINGKDMRDLSPDVECDHNNEANGKTAEAPDKTASNASCKFQSAMHVNDDSVETVVISADRSMDAGGPAGVLQDKVEDVSQEAATFKQKEIDLEDGVDSIAGEHQPGNADSLAANILRMQNNEVEDMQPKQVASEQKEPGIEDLPSGNIDCSESQLDESISVKGKHQAGDVVPENLNVFTEHKDQAHPEPSLNGNRKRKAPPGNRTERQKSRRQSVAGTGTKGESDLRRSTRSKTRPLEYSKGEQFLEGRVQDESVSSTDKHQIEDVISENPDIHTEQDNETYPEPSLNGNREKKVPPKNKRERQITSRKSLAGAGTKWESGVRRSTRHRVRPLEWWKGERLLYGRIHESLLTVIGVKYESPAKSQNEKATFRVESYVSDEYKELLEQVALH